MNQVISELLSHIKWQSELALLAHHTLISKLQFACECDRCRCNEMCDRFQREGACCDMLNGTNMCSSGSSPARWDQHCMQHTLLAHFILLRLMKCLILWQLKRIPCRRDSGNWILARLSAQSHFPYFLLCKQWWVATKYHRVVKACVSDGKKPSSFLAFKWSRSGRSMESPKQKSSWIFADWVFLVQSYLSSRSCSWLTVIPGGMLSSLYVVWWALTTQWMLTVILTYTMFLSKPCNISTEQYCNLFLPVQVGCNTSDLTTRVAVSLMYLSFDERVHSLFLLSFGKGLLNWLSSAIDWSTCRQIWQILKLLPSQKAWMVLTP